MPLRSNPVCIKCEASESLIWTNAENLGAICLSCVNEAKNELKSEENNEEKEPDDKKPTKRTIRTRAYKTRLNPSAQPKLMQPKGRGRRGLFKRQPIKAPSATATPITGDCVFYNGTYFQVGDIVALEDDDGNTYYAQLRGFLTDQYCEKSAAITWLLPTISSPSPNKLFDPATYILGPDEEITRKLDCMDFIMHAPSDYYKSRNTPYPQVHPPLEKGYIWSNLEPIQRVMRG